MLCPKCQRPIVDEGDGPYICCAHASVQWRCGDCAKVSEGFAFPYGRCPHCGGRLEAAEAQSADDEATLAAVRLAFEIELGGRAFYRRAAADCADAGLRELFARFAVMEGEHMETLSRRYHLEAPEPSADLRLEVAAIFAEVPARPQDPAQLFRLAIGLETRAAEFFAGRAEQAAPGSAERELFRELAAEEREHAESLATEYERWRAGKPGLMSGEAYDGAAEPDDPRAINAAELLLAGGDDSAVALICGEQALTRGELRRRVACAAAVWRSRGLQPGDRLAVKLPDGPDWVVALLGAIWMGAVAVPVNPRVPAPEWRFMLDEAGFARILAESFDDTPSPWRERGLALADWRRDCAAAEPAPPSPMHEDAPAFWAHSSGSSGRPKAVVHAHRFARSVEQASRESLGIGPGDRLFATSKLFFAYPQTNALYAGLKLGATVIVDPRWPSPASVAQIVAAQRPTVLFSVPTLYRQLLREAMAPQIARAGVRLCVSAGEALPQRLRDEWRRQTGLPIVDGYGTSEVLALVLVDRGDGGGFRPPPGVALRPLDAVADGVPTRVRITAPTLALGYLDRPLAQAENFRGGEFSPADYFVHEGGRGWRFAGRDDSLVKIAGRWVDLVELEERLCAAAPGVSEAAAVSVPDEDGFDAVALFFVAADAQGARAALRSGAEALAPHQRPRWLHAVDALPRGVTGKLLRRRLHEMHRTLE